MKTSIVYFRSHTMDKSSMDAVKINTKISAWMRNRAGVQLILISKVLAFANQTVKEVSSRFFK